MQQIGKTNPTFAIGKKDSQEHEIQLLDKQIGNLVQFYLHVFSILNREGTVGFEWKEESPVLHRV